MTEEQIKGILDTMKMLVETVDMLRDQLATALVTDIKIGERRYMSGFSTETEKRICEVTGFEFRTDDDWHYSDGGYPPYIPKIWVVSQWINRKEGVMPARYPSGAVVPIENWRKLELVVDEPV